MKLISCSFFVFFLFACNQPPVNVVADVIKKDCITCKAPSRKLAIASTVSFNVKGKEENTDMVLIHGGTFKMGSEEFPDAKPLHAVMVGSFLMDAHEVTNAEFEKFIKATGY